MAKSNADRCRSYRRRQRTGMIIVKSIRIAPSELEAMREKGYEDEDLATAIETLRPSSRPSFRTTLDDL